jgi:hypothetical protein
MKLAPITVITAKKIPVFLFCILYLISSSTASFELGYGLGSMGFKYEVGHKFSESFNLRLGSSEFEFIASDGVYTNGVPTISDMLFNQNTTFDLNQLSLLFDYHPWRADLRFTGGITKNKILLEVVNHGDSEFNINNYSFSDQIVDLTELTMQLTNGMSPYFGIGWSTGFDQNSGFSFSGDLGFYYAVDFALNFSAECKAEAAAVDCSKLRTETLSQQRKLRRDLKPLILPNFGVSLSYKF